MKKLSITLSDEDFSMLEKLREHKYCPRTKSQQIAWVIKCEWERLQEEKREKSPAEIVEGIKGFVSRMEKQHPSLKELNPDYIPPCADTRIIQFPVRGETA